jgi:mRNA interferase RelE/StbE
VEQGITSYKVYILPQASKEIDRLPGHVRQRVRRAVIGLRDDPKPASGTQPDFDLGAGREVWRLRLDLWRVIYLIDHAWGGVYVLAVRKRPPYHYENLASLLTDVE